MEIIAENVIWRVCFAIIKRNTHYTHFFSDVRTQHRISAPIISNRMLYAMRYSDVAMCDVLDVGRVCLCVCVLFTHSDVVHASERPCVCVFESLQTYRSPVYVRM